MGIAERKRRHKEDLRGRILDAAKKLFLKEGYEATSIRKIAAAIEFSPTTIYLYYKDKNEIVSALQQEGFKLLASKFETLSLVEDPFERLKAMGRTYMKFANENIEFYELMFVMKHPAGYDEHFCDVEDWEEGLQAFGFLLQTVKDCQSKGYFQGHALQGLCLMIWSSMHGLCTLNLNGQLDMVMSKLEVNVSKEQSVLEHTFGYFINMLEKFKE
ncbi:TetR/AcrR family transcriptional regulator [Pseudopedobacter beijingensis]|uniref:TetR/AcrR family transcriptional regulator n=1 Tax=Pseudopedobacter beijingensis TaxID=1207056 RepID=A0ABW4IEV8_9SPHI